MMMKLFTLPYHYDRQLLLTYTAHNLMIDERRLTHPQFHENADDGCPQGCVHHSCISVIICISKLCRYG